jgi:hypothetical protein
MRFFNRMTFARSLYVTLVLFVFGGIPEALAATKAPKVKITRQPAAVVAELGQTVTFGVTYTSTTPVTFQWRMNKQPLAGETADTLVIDQALPGTAGSYDVVLTNGGGATASKSATLAVNIAPPSLAVDNILDGSFTLKVAGETADSDGAFIVTGATTLQDPEAPSDTYTFTYQRLPKNKATLVINGRFYDSELGGYITSVETHSLTFTGLANDGRLVASDSMKGYMLPPIGYQQKKLNFTGKGTILIETADSADFASSSISGGTLTLGGSGSLIMNSGGNSGGLTGGTLVIGGGATTINSSGAGLIKQGSGTPESFAPGAGQNTYTGTITMNAVTINLANITFGEGVAVQLSGRSGEANFGASVMGQVNFIPSVTYPTLTNGTLLDGTGLIVSNGTFAGVISLGNSLSSDYGFSVISSGGAYTFENGLLTLIIPPFAP